MLFPVLGERVFYGIKTTQHFGWLHISNRSYKTNYINNRYNLYLTSRSSDEVNRKNVV